MSAVASVGPPAGRGRLRGRRGDDRRTRCRAPARARGPVAADALLQQLTDLRPTSGHEPGPPPRRPPAGERGEQLVVAVLGRLTPEEAYTVAGLRRRRATGLAMVLDVGHVDDRARAPRTDGGGRTASDGPPPARPRSWPTSSGAWSSWTRRRPCPRPGRPSSVRRWPRDPRADTRLSLATVVAMGLATLTVLPLTSDRRLRPGHLARHRPGLRGRPRPAPARRGRQPGLRHPAARGRRRLARAGLRGQRRRRPGDRVPPALGPRRPAHADAELAHGRPTRACS